MAFADAGEGWKVPEKSDTPVFRMYNPYADEHHYTMDAVEKESMISAGWEDECVGWYSDDAEGALYKRQKEAEARCGSFEPGMLLLASGDGSLYRYARA